MGAIVVPFSPDVNQVCLIKPGFQHFQVKAQKRNRIKLLVLKTKKTTTEQNSFLRRHTALEEAVRKKPIRHSLRKCLVFKIKRKEIKKFTPFFPIIAQINNIKLVLTKNTIAAFSFPSCLFLWVKQGTLGNFPKWWTDEQHLWKLFFFFASNS